MNTGYVNYVGSHVKTIYIILTNQYNKENKLNTFNNVFNISLILRVMSVQISSFIMYSIQVQQLTNNYIL